MFTRGEPLCNLIVMFVIDPEFHFKYVGEIPPIIILDFHNKIGPQLAFEYLTVDAPPSFFPARTLNASRYVSAFNTFSFHPCRDSFSVLALPAPCGRGFR